MTESCGLASLAVKRSRFLPQAGLGMSSGETGGWPPLPPNRQVDGGVFDGLRPVSHVFFAQRGPPAQVDSRRQCVSVEEEC